jgi:hypothetical protein
MSIVAQKESVFGNIAALRTLTDDFPKLAINNSFPSINNQGNSQDFLMDLIFSLVGFEEIREVLVDVLTYATEESESLIKESLKVELKSLVACGIDPSLPTWMIQNGIDIPVSDLDFFNILKVNPETQAGGLLYEDVASGGNSTDMNTFLYYTIQGSPNPNTWNNILEFEFYQTGLPINNSFNIKPTTQYSNLTDLNNDFIDSVRLFPSGQLITNIVDSLFGTISFNLDVNKTEKQLELEAAINSVTQCIINANEDEVIDDSFFTFSNPQLREIKEEARNRKQGIRQLKTCSTVDVNMPIEILTDFRTELSGVTNYSGASNYVEQRFIISNVITTMANHTAGFAGQPVDEYSVKLDFIGTMFKSIIRAFVNAILGPKIVTIFLVNYKIAYGPTAEYSDPIDFMKKNAQLMRIIIDRIRDMIIEILLQKVLKYITALIARNLVEAQKEKGQAQLAIILSLVGIPQDVIRSIRNNIPISY